MPVASIRSMWRLSEYWALAVIFSFQNNLKGSDWLGYPFAFSDIPWSQTQIKLSHSQAARGGQYDIMYATIESVFRKASADNILGDERESVCSAIFYFFMFASSVSCLMNPTIASSATLFRKFDLNLIVHLTYKTEEV